MATRYSKFRTRQVEELGDLILSEIKNKGIQLNRDTAGVSVLVGKD